MIFRILADATLIVHLGFIVFAAFGGLLLFYSNKVVWLHLPAALWAAAIELYGWICPLTPLEQKLRQLSGQQGYGGGFIEHYLLPAIYPGGLTRNIQIILGISVLLLNMAVYICWFLRQGKKRRSRGR